MGFLHFVLFAFCHICILLHLHYLSFEFCLICILSGLHFVTFAFGLNCILLYLQYVRFAFCQICTTAAGRAELSLASYPALPLRLDTDEGRARQSSAPRRVIIKVDNGYIYGDKDPDSTEKKIKRCGVKISVDRERTEGQRTREDSALWTIRRKYQLNDEN